MIFEIYRQSVRAEPLARRAEEASRTCSPAARRLLSLARGQVERARDLHDSFQYDPRDPDLDLTTQARIVMDARNVLAEAERLADQAARNLAVCKALDLEVRTSREALRAARACDAERARRLRDEARKLFDSLLAGPLLGTPVARRVDAARKRLDQVERELARCPKPVDLFPQVSGGTFEGTRAGRDATGQANKIEFVFKLGQVECGDYCLVSVQHYEDPTGKVIDPPSRGRTVKEGGGLKEAPFDDDAVDGYVVDNDPARSTCPCFEGQEGTPTGLTGRDEPTDVVPPNELHFETAVLCIKPPPARILGSMRWRLVDRSGEMVAEILPNGESLDWGPATPSFQKALKRWWERLPEVRNCDKTGFK